MTKEKMTGKNGTKENVTQVKAAGRKNNNPKTETRKGGILRQSLMRQ